ncbi:MAG: DUF2993 domain-containing protein [Microcoleaceae cyanobacterium]
MSSDSVTSGQPNHNRSRWLGTIVSQAVRFWLQSQVDSIQQLEVQINVGHRDLVRGKIPQIAIEAAVGVYQGIHLSQIHLNATRIQTNLSQVLKGKPLQLLEPIDVVCQLIQTQADFNASVSSPLLSNALGDFLQPWLQSQMICQSIQNIVTQSITLCNQYFIIEGMLVSADRSYPFQLQTQPQLLDAQTIVFTQSMFEAPPLIAAINLADYPLDCGSSVEIQQLILDANALSLQGKIQVNP